MVQIKSLGVVVKDRKDAKKLLGGTHAYNRLLKNKELIFINDVANNGRNTNFTSD